MSLGKLAMESGYPFIDRVSLEAHAANVNNARLNPRTWESPKGNTRVMPAVSGATPKSRSRLGRLGLLATLPGLAGLATYQRLPVAGGARTDLSQNQFVEPSRWGEAKDFLSNPYVAGGLGLGAGALLAYLLRR